MLGEKLDEHGPPVWLVNTGWTGGPVGDGEPDADRRDAGDPPRGAFRELEASSCGSTRCSGSRCRFEVPGVDARLLDPRSTWADREAYDAKARELAELFRRELRAVRRRRPAPSRRQGRRSDAASGA